MTLRQAIEVLQAEVLFGEQYLDRIVGTACGADLMSDVLAFHKENALLLTGLVNTQVIRTAEMSDIIGVVFVRGKRPHAEILAMAEENCLPIITTKFPLFESCGRLYMHGVQGSICSEE